MVPLALPSEPGKKVSYCDSATVLYFLIDFTGGQCKTRDDYEADFDALAQASGTKIVRTYSVVDKNVPQFDPCQVAAEILPAAAKKQFQVILGLWYAHATKQ